MVELIMEFIKSGASLNEHVVNDNLLYAESKKSI